MAPKHQDYIVHVASVLTENSGGGHHYFVRIEADDQQIGVDARRMVSQ